MFTDDKLEYKAIAKANNIDEKPVTPSVVVYKTDVGRGYATFLFMKDTSYLKNPTDLSPCSICTPNQIDFNKLKNLILIHTFFLQKWHNPTVGIFTTKDRTERENVPLNDLLRGIEDGTYTLRQGQYQFTAGSLTATLNGMDALKGSTITVEPLQISLGGLTHLLGIGAVITKGQKEKVTDKKTST